jgi:uncharacterized protein YndB with AHSA1/START domain
MPEILHDFPINAPSERVYQAMTDPAGLDQWWTSRSSGTAQVGEKYELDFGAQHQWRAVVTRCVPGKEFEWRVTEADTDWTGTRVGFDLTPHEGGTTVRFYHRGWEEENDHYRTSSFCWAMYLRILRRFLENGETVPYAARLDV